VLDGVLEIELRGSRYDLELAIALQFGLQLVQYLEDALFFRHDVRQQLLGW
jgi:hypothetical protein